MGISNSQDWAQTRDDIINRAYRLVRSTSSRTSPDANQVTVAAQALESINKKIQNEGVRLWTLEWATKTLTASSEVTEGGVVYTCIKAHTSADGTNKPGTDADWTTYWRTGGTAGATAWADATPYTSIGEFTLTSNTLGIESAFVRRNGNDTPINIISSSQYFEISNKDNEGQVNSLWFDRQLTPIVRLWPYPSDADDVIHYHAVQTMDDFDAASNNGEFPVQWVEYFTFELAYRLSFETDLPLNERILLQQEAEKLKQEAMGTDAGSSPINFVVPI
jgi:hypothetical protein